MEQTDTNYFHLFRNVCMCINATLNLKECLDLIAVNVTKALQVKACALFLLDRTQNRLDVSASYGLSEAYLNKGPVDAEKSIQESLHGVPILVLDATHDNRIQYPREAAQEGIASIFSVPIPVKGAVIGVLRIYTARPRTFCDNERAFIFGLAEMSGIAIENARMYDHLRSNYENLMNDVHRWFDFGSVR